MRRGCFIIKLNKSLLVITIIASLAATTTLLTGCDSKKVTTSYSNESETNSTASTPETKKEVQKDITSEKYNVQLNLEKFTLPGVFTLNKPRGWSVYKAGDYNTIAFLTRDESEPLRQAFMFGEIGIFYVDANQKQIETNYQNNNGYKVPWIDMPVVSPYNGTNFFNNFYSIMNSQIGRNFLGSAGMPIPSGFQQIEVISEETLTPLFPGMTTSLIRATLTNNGKVAQGMFTLSTYRDAYGHGSSYLVSGITAPVNEFISIKDVLLSTLKSFKMEDSYVQSGINVINENGERFRQISKTISETSDIITKGWYQRNKSYDVMSAKKSDQIMDVERVYDPDSGEVYEVENGFYDYYQTHQDQYNKQNLQPLPDSNYELWGKAPIINHSLVVPK